MSTSVPRLHPDDIELIAERVTAKLLAELRDGDTTAPATTEWLKASELAQRLNIKTSWIYEHADELGARRLGAGRKPRLRFNLERVEQALDGIAERPTLMRHRQRRTETSQPGVTRSGAPLLAIAGTSPGTTSTRQAPGRRKTATGPSRNPKEAAPR
jgi:hypothetical protein